MVDVTKRTDGELTAPIVKISAGNQSVIMLGDMGSPNFDHTISIFQNRADAAPVVLLESYTGGAHCCYHVQLAGFSKGILTRLDLGSWDNQVDVPTDQTGDGVADFKVQDDQFFYAFGSHAVSVAPPKFLNVINGVVKDVSRDPHFRHFFADSMNSAGQSCQPGLGSTANGSCPAFVAAAARVGKLDEAWSQMIGAYDPTVDWSLPTGCFVPTRGTCPTGQEIEYKSYPDALHAFLVRTGYISSAWVPPERRLTI